MTRLDIYNNIDLERDYQDAKWGGAAHDDTHTNPNDWLAYMTPYMGQATKAFWGGLSSRAAHVAFRTAMVKVAALAVAAIEWSHRREPA